MKKKISLWTLFLVVFLDLLVIGIIIPILPLVFFHTDILSGSVLDSARNILLGLLIASYPFAQFFGAPLLGALADRYGRRPVLLISLFGAAAGYLLFGLGLLISNVYILFSSRILAGFTAGNVAVVKSIIADVSDEKSKVKNFGLIGMGFGLGFIFGPFLGGILTNNNLVSWFDASTPFWFAAILLFANIIFVFLMVEETLISKSKIKINALTGFVNIKKAFSMPAVNIIFLSYFLLMFGFSFFAQFFPVFLHDKFGYTPSQVGFLFGFVGIWIALAQGVFIRPVAKRYLPQQVVRVTMLSVSVFLMLILLPKNHLMLYFILPFVAISNGMNIPNFSALFSNNAAKESQGEILGIEQSVLSLAMTIPAVISGFAISISSSLPIMLASFFIFIAWAVFALFYRERRKKFS